jgi:predicted AAA+ superfamily ATPase
MESGTPTLYQAIQNSDATGRNGEMGKRLVGMKLQQVYGVDEYFLNQLTRSIRICGNTGTDMTAYRKVLMKSTATLKELLTGVVSSFGPHVSLNEAVPDVVRATLNDSYWEGEDIIAAVKNTVERYLDLLSKVYIVHSVGAWSRNLRKEIVKGKRWYFYDNGIRNALIGDLNPVEHRNDVGILWENYIVGERMKYHKYANMLVYNYLWRTYGQQEIDWIEDRESRLHAFEFKWNPKKKAGLPKIFKKTYPDADFEVINHDNCFDWIT